MAGRQHDGFSSGLDRAWWYGLAAWATNTAWFCFALDYPLGQVELISVGETYGVVTLATDAERCDLYGWAAGVGSA